jgi:hypothetical protein
LEDADEGWELWRSSAIGEADLDQIQTRRGGYGRSPTVFRALVRVYPLVTALATDAGVDRRAFWRRSFLRWVLRIGAFADFASVDEVELEADLTRLARECDPSALSAERVDGEIVEVADGGDFDAQPLSTVVVRLVEAIRERGEVADGDLCSTLEATTGIQVPRERRDIVHGIAWQGAALHYLTNQENGGLSVWRPGSILPAPDRRWGGWSVQSFKRHVAKDKGRDVDDLAADLFSGRAGRTVRRLVRAAIRETEP